MNATAVFDVIDAYVATFRAALPDADVSDGPPIAQIEADRITVAVGDTAIDEDTAAQAEQTRMDLGLRQAEETVSVACWLVAVDGGGDMRVARGKAKDAMNALAAAIAADRTLGGALTLGPARFASTDGVVQTQTDAGAQVLVAFTVQATDVVGVPTP